jgi:hypothetical protein
MKTDMKLGPRSNHWQKHIRVVISGKENDETTCHNVRCDNVTGSIRVYPGAPIKKISSDLLRVEDDNGLTGSVEIGDIT